MEVIKTKNWFLGPGLATSDTSQQATLQTAAFPTIPYPGVGKNKNFVEFVENTIFIRMLHKWTRGV